MDEFYSQYNLSRNHLAQLLNMDPKTIKKYEEGIKITAATVNRIELAKSIIITNNIKFPDYKHFMDEIDYEIYKNKLIDINGLFKILYHMEYEQHPYPSREKRML